MLVHGSCFIFDSVSRNKTCLFRNRLTLYLHHPRDLLGLSENFWQFPYSAVELFVGEPTDVRLTKSVRVQRRSSFSEDDFFDCKDRAMTRWGRKVLGNSSGPLCRFPTMTSFISLINVSRDSFPLCSSIDSFSNIRPLVSLFYKVRWRMLRTIGLHFY